MIAGIVADAEAQVVFAFRGNADLLHILQSATLNRENFASGTTARMPLNWALICIPSPSYTMVMNSSVQRM